MNDKELYVNINDKEVVVDNDYGIYRKKVCMCCKKEVYEKLLSTKDLDGGYSHSEEWEDLGFVTAWVNFYSKKTKLPDYKDMLLCSNYAQNLSIYIGDWVRNNIERPNQDKVIAL